MFGIKRVRTWHAALPICILSIQTSESYFVVFTSHKLVTSFVNEAGHNGKAEGGNKRDLREREREGEKQQFIFRRLRHEKFLFTRRPKRCGGRQTRTPSLPEIARPTFVLLPSLSPPPPPSGVSTFSFSSAISTAATNDASEGDVEYAPHYREAELRGRFFLKLRQTELNI